MKRLIGAMAATLLLNATTQARNVNSCIESGITNCTTVSGDAFTITVYEPTSTWTNVYLGQEIYITAATTLAMGNLMEVIATNEDCSITTNIYPLGSDPAAGSIISTSWAVSGSPFSGGGDGLTASFVPTSTGTGTLTFTIWYDGASACGEGPFSASISENFAVIPLPPCDPAPSGLISWWPGQGNSLDVVSSNNASLINETWFGAGEVGEAFWLNGGNEFVNIPDSPSLEPASLTVEGWFCFRSPYSLQVLMGKPYGTSYWASWNVWYNDGALWADTATASEVQAYIAQSWAPTPGQWCHIAYTYDVTNSSQTLYVNGAVLVTGSVSGTLAYDSTPMQLGAKVQDGTPMYFFDGMIDEVSIYNRALTLTEISNIYAASITGKCPVESTVLSCDPTPSGLISWWSAEGSANDLTGPNNGSLSNGVSFGAGEVGQAFVLDGVNQFVNIPDSTSLRQDSLTVEGWFNFAVPYGLQVLMGKPYSTSYWASWNVWYNDGALWADTATTSAVQPYINYSWYPTQGEWYHIAYTYDYGATTEKLYINGIEVASGSASGPLAYDSTPMQLGAKVQDGTPMYYFSGGIDEVSFYGRALTATEISNIYAASIAGKCPIIATQTLNQTNCAGSTATFSVTAKGASPLTYQWQFNSANISGATTSTLTLTDVEEANAGTYTLAISQLDGTILSTNAVLTVVSAGSLSPTNCTDCSLISSNATLQTWTVQISTNLAVSNLEIVAVSAPSLPAAGLSSCWSLNGQLTNAIYVDITSLGKSTNVFSIGNTAITNIISVVVPDALIPPPEALDQYFVFNQTNWDAGFGSEPLRYTNLISMPDAWGNALKLDTTNLSSAFLQFNVVETNGHTNLDMAVGAVFAVVAPDWASANTNQNGAGPGERGYLLAAGDWSSGAPQGFWAIYTDAGGTNLYFGGVSNSVTNTYVSAPISWASNSIHEIGLTYGTSPSNSVLYLDGQWAATGGPVTVVPSTNTWTNGFFIGSDHLGYEQFRGVFLYLELDNSNVMSEFNTNYFTESWSWDTNNYYSWWAAQGGATPDGGGIPTPTNSFNTNYAAYTNFWLYISNSSPNVYVSVEYPLSNMTYLILTNADLSNSNGWGVWQALLATNSVTTAPPLTVGSNVLYFEGVLDWSTGTNGLPDYWCMKYFNTLNVDPYADPDGDGLCNMDEYMLGTNPTNAHTISTNHTDSQALFLAYTNDAACHYQLSIVNGANTNTLLLTMSPTQVGTNYQIYSKDLSLTNGPWRLEQTFFGTNCATSVAITLNGRNLSFVGAYGEDSDGDGLPDGYEVLATLTDPYLPDTGFTGVIDSMKDPDGDGYVNIVEYQNGTDPHVFNTPPAPTGINVVLNNDGSTTVSWSTSPGSVTGYIIYRNTGSGAVAIATNTSQTTYNDTSLSPGQNASYQIQVLLSSGPSILSVPEGNLYNPRLNIDPVIVNGVSNRYYLVIPNLPPDVTNILVSVTDLDASNYPNYFNYYPFDYARYYATPQAWPPQLTNETFWISPSALSNGVAQLTDTQVPLYGSYAFTVQAFGLNGQCGNSTSCGRLGICNTGLMYNPNPWFNPTGLIPYLDGSTQLKQNISFLMRIATDRGQDGDGAPFNYYVPSYIDGPGWFSGFAYTYPSNYVFASYYGYWGLQDPFIPFEDNYVYGNFIFNTSAPTGNVNSSAPEEETCAGGVTCEGTPVDWIGPGVMYYIAPNEISQFPTFSYASFSNEAPIPAVLDGTNSQWLYYDTVGLGYVIDMQNGLYDGGDYDVCMTNGAVNYYGLPYLSFEWPSTNISGYSLVSPGDCLNVVMDVDGGCVFAQVQPPVLVTENYYFARLGQYTNDGYPGYTFYDMIAGDPIPGVFLADYDSYRFSSTNTTPLMIFPVGQPQYIAGWAKQSVSNGAPNMFAYLGQYFDGAYLVSTNTVTTNVAGILSEYGMFYPSQPGSIALVTKPDPDQGNLQGECIVDVIGLETDANRDGVIDPTVSGPDFTTPNRPFRFWVNDNVDSGDDDGDGIPGQPFGKSDGTSTFMSSTQYGTFYFVHGTRDLVDYFPVFVNVGSLFQGSQAINPMDTNYQFKLSQADGALRFVYTTLTPTNFQNYMRDTNMAESLANAVTTTITPDGVMLTNTFLNGIATNNEGILIVEAWTNTTQPLVLDVIHDGVTNAETYLYLSMSGVEQMFRHKNLTAVVPPFLQDGLPDRLADSDVPNEPDTNDKNFVFLHGYNVTGQNARGNFCDVFKRLFWSGSHAKFYGVSWRSDTSLTSILGVSLTPNFHTNVVNGFSTASNVASFLGTLNGTNIVAAHSLGNMVVLSALNDWSAPISQYFMLDAAVAIEDVDANAPQTNHMVVSDWQSYTNRLYANEWHNLFASSDGRSTLAWAGRFTNFGSADVYNFYSSGEEVLRDYPGDPPPDVISAIPSQIWSTVRSAQGRFVWVWQEKGKGISASNDEIGSDHGGWSFNDPTYASNYLTSDEPPISPTAAAALTDSQLEAAPFFDLASPGLTFYVFTNDLALLGPSGSSYALANRNRILADAIPALTLPIGANDVPAFDVDDRNFNMQLLYENGWPSNRLSSTETNNWHHSDFREIAYTFTYGFYTNFVNVGNLK